MFARHRFPSLFLSLLLAIGSVTISQAAFAQAVGNGIADKSQTPKGPTIQGPIPVGGTWIEFIFTQTGSFATGCYPADPTAQWSCIASSAGNSVFGDTPPWTFTAPPQGATLTVTDAFNYGEVFEIFDFGVSLGPTSNVPASTGGCGDDPDVCLVDPLSSHGVFALKTGPHEITIKVIATASGSGAAYFRVDQGEARADHFVCYKVSVERDKKHRKDKSSEKLQVLINNQFGEQTFTVGDPELLCVPSTKEVIEAKPKIDAPQ